MKTLGNILITVAMLLTGCGGDYMMTEEEKAEFDAYQMGQEEREGYFRLEGYVSPINIYVNDEYYSDSEDFYTREIDRLQELMEDEYPDHVLSFDADIGLKDFKRDLQAFLTPKNDRGIASETDVDDSGAFTFTLPRRISGTDDMYTIRISKRIGLRLTNGEETIHQCYNFYAEKNIHPTENEPVLMRVFQTSLTKYKCSDSSDNFISLPSRESSEDEEDDSDNDNRNQK